MEETPSVYPIIPRRVHLVQMRNPFNRGDREIRVFDYRGETLSEIREKLLPRDVDFTISVNGRVIPPGEYDLTLFRDGDYLTFIPKIQGGDDTLRMVAMIVVAIAAGAVSYGVGTYVAGGAAWGIGAATAAVASGIAVSLVGGLVVNALLPPATPKTQSLSAESQMSQVYSWNPQTVQQQGRAVPRPYGLNKLVGNVINAYLENVDDKQYLNCLIDLGIGPVKRLYDFKINDQPIENFNGVEIHTRYGYLNQDPIAFFDSTKIEFPQSVKVAGGSSFTYTTIGNSFNGLEIDLTCPQGLWYANDQGGLSPHSVDVRVRIRPTGGAWKTITFQAVKRNVWGQASGRWSFGQWIYTFESEIGWQEISAGSADPYEHTDGEAGSFPGIWRWIAGETYAYYSVDETVDYITLSAADQKTLRRTLRAERLDPQGIYEIEISKLSADQGTSRYGEDLYLSSVREVIYEGFEYPRHVLVGIRALATDQLSGSLRFSCLCEGALIRRYTGSSWVVEFNDSPAWVLWDLLTAPVFDNSLNVIRYDGIDPSRLDLAKFYELWSFDSDGCPDGKGGYEQRCIFAGVFDTTTSRWEAALQVCQIARCTPVWQGINLTLAIDKAGTPVQLFSVGNIKPNSFKRTFLKKQDRASEIEVDFINRDSDFARSIFSVYDPNLEQNCSPARLPLMGCNRPSEAWRHAMYRLNCNRYLLQSAEIIVDVDALGSTVGDLVYVQHDVPMWGEGGRLVSATPGTVTLDKSVTLEAGKAYSIMIRFGADDALVTKVIADSPGTYNVLTLAAPFEEKVLNGGFENWVDSHNPTNWTPTTVGGSTVNRENTAPLEGVYSCRIDIDAPGNNAYLQNPDFTLVPGKRYRLSVKFKTGAAGKMLEVDVRDSGSHVFLQEDGTWGASSWGIHLDSQTAETIEIYFTAHTSYSGYSLFVGHSGWHAWGSGSLYIDGVTISQAPEKYDLYWMGESTPGAKPFRITDIERSGDYEARLSLMEYNASVYGSDSGQPVIKTPDYTAPSVVAHITGLAAVERLIKDTSGIYSVIDVTFDRPADSTFDHAQVWYSVNGSGWRFAGNSPDGKIQISGILEEAVYQLKVQCVNSLGQREPFDQAEIASLYVYGKTAPPDDVSEMWFEASAGGVKLSWSPVDDVDLDLYEVRWHPDSAVALWGNSLLVARTKSTSLALPAARDGVYFVKAVDTTGNYSATAKEVITTIPSILGWNVQESLAQEPGWSGTKTKMTVSGGDLYLDTGGAFDDVTDIDALPDWDYGVTEVPAIGYYEVTAVDLGSVQTCRCWGETVFYCVDREALFDDIANIDALENWNGDEIPGVGMLLQIALSQNGSTWGDWQNFLVGDYTAQAFKFRLKAWSNFAARYCYADSLTVGIDMPERVERGDDLSVAAGGTAVTYSKSFMTRPHVGVAIQSASAGDTVKLTSQTVSGFTVQVLDSGGSGVARTVDWRAVGY